MNIFPESVRFESEIVALLYMLCNLRLKYIAFVELSWGAELNNR